MFVIGVTGGVGAGKSEVLGYLEKKWNARIIKLDDLGHTLLEKGGGAVADAASFFGSGILRPDGSADRGGIARIVFRDPEKLEAWNRCIHPKVRTAAEKILEAERSAGRRVCAIESAILIEAHYDAICCEMWYIYADKATRYRRLIDSRGYDAARIRRTMANQLPDEAFRERAAVIIDNSGSFSDTALAVDQNMKRILNVSL